MKKIKSVLAFFLALIMAFGTFSFSVFAELPKITDLKWNDDYSVDFNFDGAKEYRTSIYINNNMIWGYGTTNGNRQSRERMLPYMTALAKDAISSYHYSGNVSFDFKIVAKNADGNSISATSTVSKTLKIEDVAAGKLSPSDEMWQYYRENTSDKTKLSNAIHAAYDPDRSTIEALLSGTGVSYDTYIAGVINAAAEEGCYIFKGTLAQTMRFGTVYNSYCYTDVSLVNKEKTVSQVDITINAPKVNQKVTDYASGDNIKCDTEGVKVIPAFGIFGAYEKNTRTYQKKFYAKNSYEVLFMIVFAEGYEPAENYVVTVNGEPVEYMLKEMTVYEGNKGYEGYHSFDVSGNFFNNIATFFHNIFMKIKYPNGMFN